MEMADNPKLALDSCLSENGGFEENMGTRKFSVLDHINGFQYSTEKSGSFVIDMESFSHGTANKDVNPNSRITLQRSLSRKGSMRVGSGGGGGSEKKINSNPSPNDRDTTTIVAASSPRGILNLQPLLEGPSMPEKASLLAVGTTDHSSSNQQVHHQITINTSSSVNASSPEGRWTMRRNSFKRSPFPWTIDPKRVLFIFATISSMGTMLLIYFTLSMGKLGVEDSGLD